MASEIGQNRVSFFLTGFVRPLRRLADAVFPPVCMGCGAITGGHRGLCPSCWGSLHLIEKPYCAVLGTPFTHDLGPGILSAEAIANPPAFDRLRSVALYEGVARDLVQGLKYRDRTDLAGPMAQWMLRACDGAVEACDGIVPVPLHRARLLARKFNQSAELARALAQASGKPFLWRHLLRTKRTARQVGLGARAREDNVRGAFTVAESAAADIFGRRIVLVDDVYTTGATVSAATRALKKAGAAEVTVLTFAMALPGSLGLNR